MVRRSQSGIYFGNNKVPKEPLQLSKFEGHDVIKGDVSHIYVSKAEPQRVRVHQKKPYVFKDLKPDNTLQDRLIQNLAEEKMILETEIGHYQKLRQSSLSASKKPASVKSVNKSKMEGYDYE